MSDWVRVPVTQQPTQQSGDFLRKGQPCVALSIFTALRELAQRTYDKQIPGVLKMPNRSILEKILVAHIILTA